MRKDMLELLKSAIGRYGSGEVQKALDYLSAVCVTKEERGSLMLRFLEQLSEGSPVSILELHKQPWHERAESMQSEIVLKVQVEIPGLQELVAALKEQNARTTVSVPANVVQHPAAPAETLAGDDPSLAKAVAEATTRKPRQKRVEPPAPEGTPMSGAPAQAPVAAAPSKPVPAAPEVKSPSNEELSAAFQSACDRGGKLGKDAKKELYPIIQQILNKRWARATECDDPTVRTKVLETLNGSYAAPVPATSEDDLGL